MRATKEHSLTLRCPTSLRYRSLASLDLSASLSPLLLSAAFSASSLAIFRESSREDLGTAGTAEREEETAEKDSAIVVTASLNCGTREADFVGGGKGGIREREKVTNQCTYLLSVAFIYVPAPRSPRRAFLR